MRGRYDRVVCGDLCIIKRFIFSRGGSASDNGCETFIGSHERLHNGRGFCVLGLWNVAAVGTRIRCDFAGFVQLLRRA